MDLALVGFSDDELEDLLAGDEPQSSPDVEEEAVPEEPANPVTRPGDLWAIGPHRLICGDCRDLTIVCRNSSTTRAPTSASRRRRTPRSGSTTRPAGSSRCLRTSMWPGTRTWRRTSRSVLAEDGSYFLNIKEHADEGERNLYVKDLVIAHRRAVGLAVRGRVLLA